MVVWVAGHARGASARGGVCGRQSVSAAAMAVRRVHERARALHDEEQRHEVRLRAQEVRGRRRGAVAPLAAVSSGLRHHGERGRSAADAGAPTHAPALVEHRVNRAAEMRVCASESGMWVRECAGEHGAPAAFGRAQRACSVGSDSLCLCDPRRCEVGAATAPQLLHPAPSPQVSENRSSQQVDPQKYDLPRRHCCAKCTARHGTAGARERQAEVAFCERLVPPLDMGVPDLWRVVCFVAGPLSHHGQQAAASGGLGSAGAERSAGFPSALRRVP